MDIILTIIAALLIFMVFFHELGYFRSTVIKTVKTSLEIIAAVIGVTAIAVVTFFFANNWFHYVLGFIGVLFVLVDVGKQGISENGILITARGKQLYKWSEIRHIDITVSSNIEIAYFSQTRSPIVTQHYSKKQYDKIIELLQRHELDFHISTNSEV